MRPIDTVNLNQAIQQQIKEHIINNKLRPGDRLPGEIEMTKRLGVSRTAVREAMKGIEALGIIEKRNGSGTYLKKADMANLLDSFAFGLYLDQGIQAELFEIRKRLELSFLPDAMNRLDAASFRRLHAIVARMHVKYQAGKSFALEDIELHEAIFESVGNETLLKLLRIFFQLYGVPNYPYQRIEGEASLARSYQRHKALVDALELRDLESARAILLDDFRHFLPASRPTPTIATGD